MSRRARARAIMEAVVTDEYFICCTLYSKDNNQPLRQQPVLRTNISHKTICQHHNDSCHTRTCGLNALCPVYPAPAPETLENEHKEASAGECAGTV